jgi:hypothetical protein
MTTISKAPKWPEGKEPTPFEKAVQVSLVEGTDNVFSGIVYEDWCGSLNFHIHHMFQSPNPFSPRPVGF